MAKIGGDRRGGDRVLNAVLMVRLQQIQETYPGPEAFLKASQVGRATMLDLLRGNGNPTFALVQQIAEGLRMTRFELLGIRQPTAETELKLHGIDLDRLRTFVTAERKNREALLALTGMTARTAVKPRRGPKPKDWA